MTLGGICLALTVISMYAASVVPGIELTLLAVSSLFTAVMLLETGVGGALLLYGASLILGIALIPNKLAVLPYGFFFGYYGIAEILYRKDPRRSASAGTQALVLCCSDVCRYAGIQRAADRQRDVHEPSCRPHCDRRYSAADAV